MAPPRGHPLQLRLLLGLFLLLAFVPAPSWRLWGPLGGAPCDSKVPDKVGPIVSSGQCPKHFWHTRPMHGIFCASSTQAREHRSHGGPRAQLPDVWPQLHSRFLFCFLPCKVTVTCTAQVSLEDCRNSGHRGHRHSAWHTVGAQLMSAQIIINEH